MKLIKVFTEGKVLEKDLYRKLKYLDKKVFFNCGNEFLKNRDWWVIEIEGKIIAYCGSIYSERICLFNRAWVHKDYRGKGLQKRMIKARVKEAKKQCGICVTYTTKNNFASANNLIRAGFTLFCPQYLYAGEEMLYFRKQL